MTPEKSTQNKILSYLHELEKLGEPIFVERRQAGGFSYKKGIPDLYFIYDGIHVEIEVKAPGGKLSVMQEKFRDLCEKRNILWFCISDSNEIKDVIKLLKSEYI